MRLVDYLNQSKAKGKTAQILMTLDTGPEDNEALTAYLIAFLAELSGRAEEINVRFLVRNGHTGAASASIIMLIYDLIESKLVAPNITIKVTPGYYTDNGLGLEQYQYINEATVRKKKGGVVQLDDGRSPQYQQTTRDKLGKFLKKNPETYIMYRGEFPAELADFYQSERLLHPANVCFLGPLETTQQKTLKSGDLNRMEDYGFNDDNSIDADDYGLDEFESDAEDNDGVDIYSSSNVSMAVTYIGQGRTAHARLKAARETIQKASSHKFSDMPEPAPRRPRLTSIFTDGAQLPLQTDAPVPTSPPPLPPHQSRRRYLSIIGQEEPVTEIELRPLDGQAANEGPLSSTADLYPIDLNNLLAGLGSKCCGLFRSPPERISEIREAFEEFNSAQVPDIQKEKFILLIKACMKTKTLGKEIFKLSSDPCKALIDEMNKSPEQFKNLLGIEGTNMEEVVRRAFVDYQYGNIAYPKQ